MTQIRTVDLLVAGAGAGGMAAALAAALEGLDVLLCEKSDQVGGTASTSAGTLWIPGNRQSRDAGYDDTAEAASVYLDALVGDKGNRNLRQVFLDTGPDAIDYFVKRSEIRFLPCGRHPDYHANVPGAAITGRAIIPEAFDGRLLGEDFRRVRPPIPEFMIFGGMMVSKADIPHLLNRFGSISDFLYAARLFSRYLADRIRYRRGTRLVLGNALAGRLLYSLKQKGVPILYEAAIRKLHGDTNGITGATLETLAGAVEVHTRRGVVLATGGFGHDGDFRRRFLRAPVEPLSMAFPGNTGDGVRLGSGIGARIAPEEHGNGGFWSPVSKTRRADGSEGLYPHLAFDRAKPGLIAVNAAGRRFVNEGVSYHDFVEGMFRAHAAEPSIPAYLVCDAPFIRKYGFGQIHPGVSNLEPFEKSSYLVTAPTLGELARKLGIDGTGLADSVARNNHYAISGIDEDFGKGETELNRFNGDPEHRPNPCLGPITQPPFCAIAVWPAEIAVSTGLSTNEDAQVMDVDGQPIQGLYACGNDMASVMAGSYPGPGTTLGPALVFAYRAAMHAAHSSHEKGRREHAEV